MSSSMPTIAEHEQVDRLHGRFGDLWRQAEWRCVYAPRIDRPGGILRLYMGSAMIAQVEAHSVDEMLRVSSWWREVITAPPEWSALRRLGLVPIPEPSAIP